MSTSGAGPQLSPPTDTLASVGEVEALKRIFPRLPGAQAAILGPGDDCAVVAAPDARFVVTTDMMIHGPDFRLAWSTPHDLGWKAAMTNLADVAAMGATPTALVVAIAAPLDTPAATLEGIADGLRDACAAHAPGCGVVGGDLSVSNTLTLAVTAFGSLEGRQPVTRSGARVGDTVAVAGTLGLAGAGIALLFAEGTSPGADTNQSLGRHEPAGRADSAVVAHPRASGEDEACQGDGIVTEGACLDGGVPEGARQDGGVTEGSRQGGGPDDDSRQRGTHQTSGEPNVGAGRRVRRAHPAVVEAQLAPTSPLRAGVAAAEGGARSMLDVSDGLILDAGRIAQASGVTIDFSHAAIEAEAASLNALDPDISGEARDFVLCGGEDHALLATFPSGQPLPAEFRPIGVVVEREGEHPLVTIGGSVYRRPGGWDPFSGWNGATG